jgi:hypothetical protein
VESIESCLALSGRERGKSQEKNAIYGASIFIELLSTQPTLGSPDGFWFPSPSYFQGCQIFLFTTYQNRKNIPQNTPNDQQIYQITNKYTKLPTNIPNGH